MSRMIGIRVLEIVTLIFFKKYWVSLIVNVSSFIQEVFDCFYIIVIIINIGIAPEFLD